MHVKINHYLLYKCGEGSVNFSHVTPILRETGKRGGGVQNCDPIDYLQISSKGLTAMQPVFFILVLTYLETILMVVVNFFAELWLSYQSHLFILLNHNFMVLHNRNEIQIPS